MARLGYCVLMLGLVALVLAQGACIFEQEPEQQLVGVHPHRLRVTNTGPEPISNLTVLFPEERIAFGDIPAGATTGYRGVPGGVYRYAAYSLTVSGEVITQAVIDWVGESPLEGTLFTYAVNVDPDRDRWQIVRLVAVTKDD